MWKGTLFPFLFITIACGAVSGFHALIASGTTPKLLANETDARFIGYGAMLMESFVAIMALVAASIIEPGLYFAMNTPPAALGITMPDLHRPGTEDAPMIMASLKDVTVHAAAAVSSGLRHQPGTDPADRHRHRRTFGAEPRRRRQRWRWASLTCSIRSFRAPTWASGTTSAFCSRRCSS